MFLISNWLPPSHTFSCLPLFSHPHSVVSFFFSHVQSPPLFSHPHSVTYLFFPTLSVVSPFFSHLFSSLLFFLIHLQLSPLFSHNTFSCLPFFSHMFSSQLSPLFFTLSVVSFFSHTFICLLFFLKYIRLPSPFKNIYIYFSISLPLFNTLSLPSPFFPHLPF